jgi:hypothetical protein
MNMQSLNLGEPRWLTRVAAGAKRKVRRSIKRRGEFGTVIYIAWYITFGRSSNGGPEAWPYSPFCEDRAWQACLIVNMGWIPRRTFS